MAIMHNHNPTYKKPDYIARLGSDKLEIDCYETTPNYTLVRMSRQWSQRETLSELEKWCIQCQCGKRVNTFSFAFKTEEELTMFKLRWL